MFAMSAKSIAAAAFAALCLVARPVHAADCVPSIEVSGCARVCRDFRHSTNYST